MGVVVGCTPHSGSTGNSNSKINSNEAQQLTDAIASDQEPDAECDQEHTLPIRLTLLPEVSTSVSASGKQALEHKGLRQLQLSRLKPSVWLGGDDFRGIFTTETPPKSGYCVIECVADEGGVSSAYITDLSFHDIRVDGELIGL